MLIKGLQKMTLLDYPGRVAATIFTPGCDFRCPFCHNASLVMNEGDESVAEEEVLALLKKRKGVLTGLAVTGGEPLLQEGLEDFLRKVKDLGMDVKLDHNGSFPGRLERIIKQGLVDYVAMDIKNCREKYAATCGLPEEAGPGLLENIDRSIAVLRSSGIEYEFRTTVVRELHSKEDIEAMGEWMKGDERFFLQAFVDSGDIIKPGLSGYSGKELAEMLEIFRKYLPKAQLRGV
ncbi:MAG: anaerobic ribonucleoside-triphosphate reductase activating protein [Firmicutes bacterium]|nr:anaerobic ribonucleoside-triphosphate reductase activating protein [Bacillota bacterium]